MDIPQQIEEKWLVLWWLLAASVLAFTIAWAQGFFKPYRPPQDPLIQGKEVLLGFGSFIFAEIVLVPFLAGTVFFLAWGPQTLGKPISQYAQGWISCSMLFAGFGAASLAYFFLPPSKRHQFWSQPEGAWYRQIGIGISAWFLGFPIVAAASQGLSLALWYLFQHVSNEQSAVQVIRNALAHPLLFWLTALCTVTVVPLTEEFLFRGLLQSWLKQKFGSCTASILLTSVIFAFFHYSADQGLSNIELLFPLFLFSCLLGYLYERERSLWAPIALHGFFNFISVWMIFYD